MQSFKNYSLFPEDGADQRWRRGTWEYDVFISHAGEDKTFAHRLRDAFKTIGLRAFLDQSSLVPGDQADQLMLTAVERAPVGLALLSTNFPQKPWPINELRVIVQQGTLLPVLYKISYEDAKTLMATSPQAAGVSSQEWGLFVDSVMRTTALKDPSTSSDEGPLVQTAVFSAVRMCIAVARKMAYHSEDKLRAYRFIERLEGAAKVISREFDELRKVETDEAKTWFREMQFLAQGLAA